MADRRQGGVALALYLLCSCGFLGAELLTHRGGWTYLGTNSDAEIYLWAFAWWPHAIAHGLNPIVTHEIWAPNGVDLAWTTSVPALALLFTPLTAAVGALASFNVALMLTPALAAWTAFLLCRHITKSFWPSLAGGYLFGSSSYLLGQAQQHLFLSAVFVVPLLALVVLRYVEGELSGRGLALRFGPLLALQLGISTEVAFTATLALACALVLAFVFAPARRRRLLAALAPITCGYGFAAIVASPLVYYWLTDFKSRSVNPISPELFSLDLLNLVVPTNVTAIGHWWSGSLAQNFTTGSLSEAGGYVGIPALAIVVWFAASRRRRGSTWFLVGSLALAVLAALGGWLTVDGRRVITLPWEHVGYLPLFDNVLTVRLCVYVALAVAVIVAIWASSSSAPRVWRTLLTVLAVVAVLPNVATAWTTRTDRPAFFADKLYRSCIRPDDRVAIFPFLRHGDSMLWQVESGFWFAQAGGYVAPNPPDGYLSNPSLAAQITTIGTPAEPNPAALLELVHLKHIDVVAVAATPSEPWESSLAHVAKAKRVGGVLLYRFRGTTPPSCA